MNISGTTWALGGIFLLSALTAVAPQLNGWVSVIATAIIAGLAAVLHMNHVNYAASTGSPR